MVLGVRRARCWAYSPRPLSHAAVVEEVPAGQVGCTPGADGGSQGSLGKGCFPWRQNSPSYAYCQLLWEVRYKLRPPQLLTSARNKKPRGWARSRQFLSPTWLSP